MNLTKKELTWNPSLIRQLRGKRTQSEFGALLGVPKNTVWRWESGQVKPAGESAGLLSALAEKEHFLSGWNLRGSLEIVGGIEEGSKLIRKMVKKSLLRSAKMLAG